ncbi:hypothetical protein TSO221_25770 [Azospirillum sp. TSO22-1]|nr:hypothetical protein TSO221_25770 [Azospirillum sp. TSO22-1]
MRPEDQHRLSGYDVDAVRPRIAGCQPQRLAQAGIVAADALGQLAHMPQPLIEDGAQAALLMRRQGRERHRVAKPFRPPVDEVAASARFGQDAAPIGRHPAA